MNVGQLLLGAFLGFIAGQAYNARQRPPVLPILLGAPPADGGHPTNSDTEYLLEAGPTSEEILRASDLEPLVYPGSEYDDIGAPEAAELSDDESDPYWFYQQFAGYVL